jgi:hypothetical protein
MNKFILNFNDYVNEHNKSCFNTTYFALNESDDVDNSNITKFKDYATKRLKDKVLYHITENDADANLIVSKSNNLIDAADKVFMNNYIDDNWFMKNIYTIGAGGLTILGIIALFKGKKLKLARFEEQLKKIELEKFISDSKNLLASTTNDLNSGFGNFSKSLEQVEKRLKLQIEYLEKWKNSEAIRIYEQPLKYFQAKFSHISDTYKEVLIEIDRSLNVSTGGSTSLYNDSKFYYLQTLKSELKLLNNDLNWNFLSDEIPYGFNKSHRGVEVIEWKKIDYLDGRVKELFNNDRSSPSAINGISSGKKFFDEVKAGMIDFNENLYPALSKITKTLINKIDESLLKLENKKLPNLPSELLSFLRYEANVKSLEYVISKIEYKQLNSLLPEVYKTIGVLSTTASSILYITRLLTTDLFKDISEIQPVINIINNNKSSQEFYVSKIKETSGYNQTLDLNLDYTKFKDNRKKENLTVYIQYYLADIILEYMKYISSIQLYSQLVKKN